MLCLASLYVMMTLTNWSRLARLSPLYTVSSFSPYHDDSHQLVQAGPSVSTSCCAWLPSNSHLLVQVGPTEWVIISLWEVLLLIILSICETVMGYLLYMQNWGPSCCEPGAVFQRFSFEDWVGQHSHACFSYCKEFCIPGLLILQFFVFFSSCDYSSEIKWWVTWTLN